MRQNVTNSRYNHIIALISRKQFMPPSKNGLIKYIKDLYHATKVGFVGD